MSIYTYPAKGLCSSVKNSHKGLTGASWGQHLHVFKGLEEVHCEDGLVSHGSWPVATLYNFVQPYCPMSQISGAVQSRKGQVVVP